jgi:hypothetical protein
LGGRRYIAPPLCQVNIYKEEYGLAGVKGKDQVAEYVLARPSKASVPITISPGCSSVDPLTPGGEPAAVGRLN